MTLPIIIAIFFMAVLLGLIALYMWFEAVRTSPAYELKKRLRGLALRGDPALSSDLAIEILREMTPLDRILYRYSIIRRLDRLRDSAGLKIDVKGLMLILITSVVFCFLAGVIFGRNIIPGVILAAIGLLAPIMYLQAKKAKRAERFTEQFPNALDMMARSLRAGHSITSAIMMVGTEMADPIAGIFKTAYDEQALGLNLRDALEHMLERVESRDLQLFVTALNIHKEVGGNLAETMEKLAHTIRERLKLRRQVRVFSAQARFSAVILLLLPPCMALFFFYFLPGYMEELVDSRIGRYAIGYAVISQLMGFLVIRKIINIRI